MAELAKIVAQILRRDGHEVDCFCDGSTSRYCFRWSDHFEKIEDANVFSFLTLPEAQKAFLEDKKWLDWCDAVVMLFPCGNSAHLEGGYAKGAGKKVFMWGKFPQGYFENMYSFLDGIYNEDELAKLREALRRVNKIEER